MRWLSGPEQSALADALRRWRELLARRGVLRSGGLWQLCARHHKVVTDAF